MHDNCRAVCEHDTCIRVQWACFQMHPLAPSVCVQHFIDHTCFAGHVGSSRADLDDIVLGEARLRV